MRVDLAAVLESAGEPAEPSVVDLLLLHVRQLERWNLRFNLTRITSWAGILDRHVRESLLPLRWIGQRGRLLDIGTGNGFPAIPILACRSQVDGVLVERSEKKCLFLESLLRDARRTNVGIETRDLQSRTGAAIARPADYVISRATFPPGQFLEMASSWTVAGGRVFLFAGEAGLKQCSGPASGFELLSAEPIEGRRDSRLLVFERRA